MRVLWSGATTGLDGLLRGLGNVAILYARKQARRYAGGSEPGDLLGARALRYRAGDSSGDGVSEGRLEAIDISAVFPAFP